MSVSYQEIDNITFNRDFYPLHAHAFNFNDKHFYYSREVSFQKIFQQLVFKLKVINLNDLQLRGEKESIIEREKIEVMERAMKMGEYLIEENKDILFKNKELANKALNHYFLIAISAKDFFINDILKPLLSLVKKNDKHTWKNMENKKGLWRELNENEPIVRGSEVSINITTGVKMLKL